MGKRDISVNMNYPNKEEDLKELQERKATVAIEILKEKYGKMILEEYVSSIRENKEDYS